MAGLLGTFEVYFGGSDPWEYGVPITASGAVARGRLYVTAGGERLDQVAQVAYGKQLGAVEALLLANPGLADQTFELPPGLAIELPELVEVADGSRAEALFGSDDDNDDDEEDDTSTPAPRVYVTAGGERVDQVAQVAYGFQLGAVEALLVYNPGLADESLELPAGLEILLPVLTSDASAQANATEVSLWA